MTVRRTVNQATRPRPIWRCYAPRPTQGDLAALRDQAARAVPDLGLLVEPAAADMPAAGGDAERPGGGHRAHVPGQLHGRRPADRGRGRTPPAAARPRPGRAGRRRGRGPHAAGSSRASPASPAGSPRSQPAGGRVQPEVDLLGVAGERAGRPRTSWVRRTPRWAAAAAARRSRTGRRRRARHRRAAPVVTVVSSTGRPSWIRVARAVAATFPCFSQVTSIVRGLGPGRAEEVRAGRDRVGMRRGVEHRAQHCWPAAPRRSPPSRTMANRSSGRTS